MARKLAQFAALAGLLSLTLVGCGPSGDDGAGDCIARVARESDVSVAEVVSGLDDLGMTREEFCGLMEEVWAADAQESAVGHDGTVDPADAGGSDGSVGGDGAADNDDAVVSDSRLGYGDVDQALVGNWVFTEAPMWLYFFTLNDVTFTSAGNVQAGSELGTFSTEGNGNLRVVESEGLQRDFTYVISGDLLTITDSAGDYGVWAREGSAAANVAADLGQPTSGESPTLLAELVGQWAHVSGGVWGFFADVDFEVAANADITDLTYGEPGRLIFLDDGTVTVDGQWMGEANYTIDYDAATGYLTISDGIGGSGSWVRVLP